MVSSPHFLYLTGFIVLVELTGYVWGWVSDWLERHAHRRL